MTNLLADFLNAVALPLRLVASHNLVNRLGFRSVRDERVRAALPFCRRCLLDVGCGKLRHTLARCDTDQTRRPHAAGELMGMDGTLVRRLFAETGFDLKESFRFVCRLNSLYVAVPAQSST